MATKKKSGKSSRGNLTREDLIRMNQVLADEANRLKVIIGQMRNLADCRAKLASDKFEALHAELEHVSKRSDGRRSVAVILATFLAHKSSPDEVLDDLEWTAKQMGFNQEQAIQNGAVILQSAFEHAVRIAHDRRLNLLKLSS